ncbi:MAG: hypothetical protein KJO95_11920 [Gammaproteobacteria bacterium]|nr:hypothetical protein [Gammaproteobacteria bacterium]MBU2675937.1 hypothetical protein [Gammaproteobacteria bacterium]NNC56714.1 hypothetical protein [Woeseiaceae bacterium]NNL49673.1 hypothetical protein [Woeseiaceae bacterium]
MPTLAGRNTRTITGYVATLLDYPRWVIEREVDFTECHLSGGFEAKDELCASCAFGEACCWLNSNRALPTPDVPLDKLLHALGAAVAYLRKPRQDESAHPEQCECDACEWLREAVGFLRTHRHKA